MQEVLDSRSPPAQGQASRERRPLDSGHGLWPWALARDRVPSEGKSSRGRPERSAAKSKGDEVGAPGSARGYPLAEVLEDTKAKGCPLPSSQKPNSVPMHTPVTNFDRRLPTPHARLAGEVLKDP